MADFVSDEVVILKCKDIVIPRDIRQRKLFTTDDLEASIRERGVLMPIVVYKNLLGGTELIIGERRLTACINIGRETIPVRYASHRLSRVEREIIEFEENVKRQDLSWPEIVEAVTNIHNHYVELHPKWTQEQTGTAVGYHPHTVHMMMQVAEAITAGDTDLENCPSWRNAYSVLEAKRERQRESAAAALHDEIEDILSPTEPIVEAAEATGASVTVVGERPSPKVEGDDVPPPRAEPKLKPHPDAPIINGDFFEFARTYSGAPFNFLHCDFPYGLEHDDSDQGNHSGTNHKYDDDPELYWKLLETLSNNLDRLVSSSAHLIFWHAWKFHMETREFFAREMEDLWVQDVPLIWHKSDNRGIMADASRRPRNTTEVALFISRGDRRLIAGQAKANSYAAPTSKVIHQSEKPVPVLKHFFSMLVDENTRMLDPTSGSANALIAADHFGADQVLGIEKDDEYFSRSVQHWRKYSKLKEIAG